jgi:hypothetical protein
MLRSILSVALIAVVSLGSSSMVIAAEAADNAPAAPVPTAYSSAQTDIGTLLDNSATKAILEKHAPQLLANTQIEMARAMTLKQIQSYASDMITDEVIAKIDADLATISPKK